MKIPHTLRVVILLLRIALGVNFFYIGFGILFSPAIGRDIRTYSFSGLYSWVAAPGQFAWLQPAAQWAFLIIGVCLAIGLLTRLASIAGIALVLLSYLPTVSFGALGVPQFINDEVIVVICLLILFVSNAGKYIGMDNFIHIHPPKKEKN
jgi:thiosulfate dehydrogenase [quinone] large subunit